MLALVPLPPLANHGSATGYSHRRRHYHRHIIITMLIVTGGKQRSRRQSIVGLK